MTSPTPVPVADPDSEPFWRATEQGRLVVARCLECHRWQHPPTETCRHCGGAFAFETVSGDGTVFSFIVVRQATVPGHPVPYVVALVELDEDAGVRLSGVVRAGIDEVAIGTRVRAQLVAMPGTTYRAPEFVVT